MNLSDFDYRLPEQLIAQQPLAGRADSRMLVLDRRLGAWRDAYFRDFPQCLQPGDCLVLNDSRVIPSRLLGAKEPGGRQCEVFLLRAASADRRSWRALVKPGRALRPGARLRFSDSLAAEVLAQAERGERVVRFECGGAIDDELDRAGHVPLPPYIRRPDRPEDRERYQTVFARARGSVAAPTAGLHFTPGILDACRAAGAEIARLTLHVGLGTFQPLANEQVEANQLHEERFEISAQAAAELNAARRLVAVGTTCVRTLESAWSPEGWRAAHGETRIFIYPGYQFRAPGALLTNFHLPRSSLLLLVSAFAGRELILDAYHHAVCEKYRFFSYGDCMLIL